MGVFSFLVKWCADVTGNFGWGIVLSMLIFAIVGSPLYFLQRAHRRKKKKLKPAVDAIRAKYNASKIGFDTEHDDTLPDDIRAMSVDQRSEAMANELRVLYKENHFHVYTGWIPGVMQYVLAIFLYSAIIAATPEGSVYAQNAWEMVKSGAVDWSSLTMIMLIVLPSAELVTAVLELLMGKAKKAVSLDVPDENVKKKSAKIGLVLSIALPVGLGIFFGFRMCTALALAFTVLILGRFVLVVIGKFVKLLRKPSVRTQ